MFFFFLTRFNSYVEQADHVRGAQGAQGLLVDLDDLGGLGLGRGLGLG